MRQSLFHVDQEETVDLRGVVTGENFLFVKNIIKYERKEESVS